MTSRDSTKLLIRRKMGKIKPVRDNHLCLLIVGRRHSKLFLIRDRSIRRIIKDLLQPQAPIKEATRKILTLTSNSLMWTQSLNKWNSSSNNNNYKWCHPLKNSSISPNKNMVNLTQLLLKFLASPITQINRLKTKVSHQMDSMDLFNLQLRA